MVVAQFAFLFYQGETDANNIIKNQKADLQDLFHQSFLTLF